MKASEVIEYFGSQTEAAKAIEVSIPSVWAWVANDSVPMLRQYQIEIMTKGKLKADK